MKYKTKVTLECSYGLGQAWELKEATIEYESAYGCYIPYHSLRELAIKAVGGLYVTYGAMYIVEEMNDAKLD